MFYTQDDRVVDHRLGRLRELIETARDLRGIAEEEGLGVEEKELMRLCERGAFAMYRECIDAGMGPEARLLLGI